LGVRVNYRHVASAAAVSVRPIYLCDGEIVAVQDEVGRMECVGLGHRQEYLCYHGVPVLPRLRAARRRAAVHGSPSLVPRHFPISFIDGFSRGHEGATRQTNARGGARSTVTTPALGAPPLLNQAGSSRARRSDPSSDLVPRPPSPPGEGFY